MLRFRRFKANFNISKIKENNLLHYDDSPGISLTGAYRINKDELFGTTNYPNPPKKITPSMVNLPPAQTGHRKEISKSTNNLAQPFNDKVKKTKSTPNIPEVVPEPLTRIQIKEQKKFEENQLDEQKKLEKKQLDEQKKQLDEQKKLEKKQLDEQKKQLDEQKKLEKKQLDEQKKQLDEQKKLEKKQLDEQKKQLDEQKKLEKKQLDKQKKQLDEQKKQAKLAAKEQEKERERTEQLRKEREKQLQKTKEEEKRKSKRASEPQPQAENVLARPEVTTRPERPKSTNTLESSISKSSGPPPYSPKEDINIVSSDSDPSGNIGFSDEASWNMVTQHRREINRPVVVKSIPKQTHLDLHYNVGPNATANTDA